MPLRPLTVVLNSNNNKKFVLLATEDPPKEIILREARNKFRNKGLSVVYLRGGAHLEDNSLIPDSVSQVWVSKGEPYSGPPESKKHSSEIRIIRDKSFVDEQAIQQLRFVAGLEGVRLAVGMPDLHPGNRFPIGCAIAANGIYPALVGSDVGCGIALYRLSPSTPSASPSKLASYLDGLDDPWSGEVSLWLSQYGIQRSSEFDVQCLGTVGAGNHFAEICRVERILDPSAAASLEVDESGLYLLIHTGSRGLGASILASQTVNNSNPYLLPDSPELEAYLVEHNYAVQWAVANRDLLAHRIKCCIYPGRQTNEVSSWMNGLDKIIDVTHNSVTRHALAVDGDALNYWVHRKGAAPANLGVVPCPGSRGDFSWLLQPTGNGEFNAHSLAHGAGRRYSRNALHSGSKIPKSSLTTTDLGSEVVCTDTDLLVEERPEAYKDIGCVVDDMQSSGVAQGIVILRPVVTYKVRGKVGRSK